MSQDNQVAPNTSHFPKLSEHNYHTWKFDIQALLQRNGTWRVVSGRFQLPESPSPPGETDQIELWHNLNKNAAGLIYSQVEPAIQSLIREFLDDSVGMWKKLMLKYMLYHLSFTIFRLSSLFTLAPYSYFAFTPFYYVLYSTFYCCFTLTTCTSCYFVLYAFLLRFSLVSHAIETRAPSS